MKKSGSGYGLGDSTPCLNETSSAETDERVRSIVEESYSLPELLKQEEAFESNFEVCAFSIVARTWATFSRPVILSLWVFVRCCESVDNAGSSGKLQQREGTNVRIEHLSRCLWITV